MNKRLFTASVLATSMLLLAGAPTAAIAQEKFPSKSVRWIVPYAAGGGSDFLARTISQAWGGQIHRPIVVDNRPGGNTAIGASETARATADGYTILSADNGTLIFNPVLYKSLSYNPGKDLAPVTLMGRFPMILVAGPGEKPKPAKQLIADGNARKEGINYASAGAGSPHHLAMELLKSETGIKLTHAPYRGAAPALADVAGGQLPVMMVDMAAGAGFIKGGKVRPLAVANATRLPQLPDVPTFAELGLPNVQAAALVGMVAPAKTPATVIAALNKQVVAAINEPAVKQKLIDFGVEPVGNTPEQFQSLINSESTRWQKLIKDLNITLD
ncbi:MAG: tripartite tricarboxylate transporter substrate binding protein [Comamonas sp.]